uniref:Uncharacterized protein n=1 Tax=Haptolina brevifila TaxID=156173 RepID=A0A7S2DM62_9EUKA|mmetsp:Transcript_4095/g.8874  ORF Transcript_4095/g.8874 Transcript_4095/m.8874 type:complete len:124 (+) Transcript_4095:136-507(+)
MEAAKEAVSKEAAAVKAAEEARERAKAKAPKGRMAKEEFGMAVGEIVMSAAKKEAVPMEVRMQAHAQATAYMLMMILGWRWTLGGTWQADGGLEQRPRARAIHHPQSTSQPIDQSRPRAIHIS